MEDVGRNNIMFKELAIQRELAYRRKVEMYRVQFDNDSMRYLMPLEVPSSTTGNQSLNSNPPTMHLNPAIASIVATPSREMQGWTPSYQLPSSTSTQNQNMNPAITASLLAPSSIPSEYENQNIEKKPNTAMHSNPSTSSLVVAPLSEMDRSHQLPLTVPSLWGNKRKRNAFKKGSSPLSDSVTTTSHGVDPSNQLALSILSLSGNKRKKAPEGVIYCEVCQVPCSGTSNYNQHLQGQKHKSKLQLLEMNKKGNGGESTSSKLSCELCQIWCTCEDALKLHLKGQKHLLKLYQTTKKSENDYHVDAVKMKYQKLIT